jgi:pullulanase
MEEKKMRVRKKMATRMMALAMAVCMTVLAVVTNRLPVYAEGGPVLRLHYHRDDGDYAPWRVWFWEEGKEGGDYYFEEEDGDMVATLDVTPGTTSVGFIVRTEDWAKDYDADQYIDISEVVSGTVDVYVESGVEGYTKEYGDDTVTGTKLKNAKYNGDGTISVTMTGELTGDLAGVFAVSGKSGDVAVSDVTYADNFVYTVTLAEELISTKSYSITYDGTAYEITMPNIYSTEEFESAYTYEGDDLGATWTAEKTTFRVWAPTADELVLNLYESGNSSKSDKIESIAMTPDVNGTWVAEKEGDLNGTYYTYSVTIDGTTQEACDPYARTTGVNGKRAMVIDLDSTDPEGWDEDTNPHAGESINDAVIYEGHIRDLTVDSDSGITNAGKYLGLTETGTTTSSGIATGLDHIKELGVTHLHILPMYDFGSVDETYTYANLYNWGYDPVNYNVPEGSYSTDPYNGEVRVSEVKQMVKGLHDNGISVVMDVVYNHVYSASDFCFNKLVPGYFSRVNSDGSYSNGSGCGNDTASERSMVKKYIVESVNYWADEYHIDGFRFDLVGLLDVDTINEIVETVHETHPDVIFYGEGWTLSTNVTKVGVTLATQTNSSETPDFAYFNDTIRDGLKGNVFNETATGFVSGATGLETSINNCFLGNDSWCSSPSQTINYVSCHDNNTLFDRLQLSRSDAEFSDLVKMNNLAAAIYLTAEGVPFMQAGEEMLRSKPNGDGTFNSNSYNAGDTVNAIDWSTLEDSAYAAVFDYYKGLIAFRKAHAALRLSTAEDVASYVTTLAGLDDQVVGYEIAGGMDGESAEAIYLVFNASEEDKTITLPDGDWNVYINSEKAGTTPLATVSGETTVGAISALVLVKETGVTVSAEDTAAGDTATDAASADNAGTDAAGDAAAADTSATESTGTNAGVIVIICIAAVAVVAAAVFGVRASKKKQQEK